MTIVLVDIALLTLLMVVAFGVLRMKNLFAATMLMGIYSLLSAGLFVTMDAMDVAFTEAAVGAGVSTVLMLGALALVGYEEKQPKNRPLLPLIVTGITTAILLYGTLDMPPFGEASNPVHQHVAPHYLYESYPEMGITNTVTIVLGSYRGFDTMGEAAVVFTALVGVLLLLARGSRRETQRAEAGPAKQDELGAESRNTPIEGGVRG